MNDQQKWIEHYDFLIANIESFKNYERELRIAKNKKQCESVSYNMDVLLATVKSYIKRDGQLFIMATDSWVGDETDNQVRSANFQELLDKKVFTMEADKVLDRIKTKIGSLTIDK